MEGHKHSGLIITWRKTNLETIVWKFHLTTWTNKTSNVSFFLTGKINPYIFQAVLAGQIEYA